MKVLITTDLYHVDTNGVVTSVRNLKQELQRKGYEVRVLTVSRKLHSHTDGEVYNVKSVPIGKIYPDMRMPVSYRNKYIRELIAWKPDIIHSQCEFFSFFFARYISKKTGAPIVHTYHTLYEQYVGYVLPGQRFGSFVVRKFSKNRLMKTDAVIAPTNKVERILHGYGVTNPIHIVPSGITLQQHLTRISKEDRESKRQSLGFGPEHRVLVNLGRLGTEKNLDELVALFAAAARKDENLRLLIVGDGPARANLEKMVKDLQIVDKVVFTGMVDPKLVQEYYQLGDIFVSASTSETQGLTYVEAAANGLPLLCREDPCLEEVLYKGENGFTYTNEEEFLNAVDEILEDPQWRENAGKRSTEIASAFDKDAFCDAVEAVYMSVV